MKRCPECRRDYYDDTLLYCLDDGTELLEGPASGDQSKTAVLNNGSESATAIIPGASSSAKTPGKWPAMGVVLALVAIGGIGFAVYRSWTGAAKTEQKPISIDRLTTNGRATTAAISPDGKFYVYTVDDGGKHSLWVRQLATSREVEIIPAAEDVYYWGVGFTPDSNYINF